MDRNGWVIDFGKGGFGRIREWLHATFDHTLLVAQDDPARDAFSRLGEVGVADVRVVPSTSCEGLAEYVFHQASPMIDAATGGRCWILEVECLEHGANSAIYCNLEGLAREARAEALRTAIACG